MRKSRSKATRLALGLLAAVATCSAQAVAIGPRGCDHVVDGLFNGSSSSTSDGLEWGCATVSKHFFAPATVGVGGNAWLYVNQSGSVLNLMYDYVGGGSVAASFFDVFFEVVPDGHAYLVRIGGSSLQAFERLIGSVAPLDATGSFAIGSNSGWDPLSDADLALAQFKGALGFGSSQNNAAAHPMAEFQLTINSGGNGHPNGIYDPSPAFWSASAKPGGAADPPISAGIFTLNPNGTTTVVPLVDANGAPLMQGSVVPEPATLGLCLAGLLAMRWTRRTRELKV